MLEFAFVAPLLVLFVINIIDLGQALYVHQVVLGITREAVRQLSMQPGLETSTVSQPMVTNVRLGCSVGYCPENHIAVHERINSLITTARVSGQLPIYSDAELSLIDPDFAKKQQMIETQLLASTREVTARVRVRYRGFFSLLDGINVDSVKAGPYLLNITGISVPTPPPATTTTTTTTTAPTTTTAAPTTTTTTSGATTTTLSGGGCNSDADCGSLMCCAGTCKAPVFNCGRYCGWVNNNNCTADNSNNCDKETASGNTAADCWAQITIVCPASCMGSPGCENSAIASVCP